MLLLSDAAVAREGSPVAAEPLEAALAMCDASGGEGARPDGTESGASHDSPLDASARPGPTDVLTDAARRIARAHDPATCRREMTRGERSFLQALRRNGRRFSPRVDRPAIDPVVAAIQREVTQAWAADQTARTAYVDLDTTDRQGAAWWARSRAAAHAMQVDATSSALVRRLIDEVGWIDRARFGGDVAAHAWLLVQHADADPELQADVLGRMEALLAQGGIHPPDYAYLWDRVAVNAGRLQRYGTQPVWDCTSGALVLQPVEDPDRLDTRRAAMGMGPAAEDLARMSANTCR